MSEKIETLIPIFCEFIPVDLKPGVIYISREYRTAIHLCCCGCGEKSVTPWNPETETNPHEWKLTENRDLVTLVPSILNQGCQAHYFIRENKVIWT